MILRKGVFFGVFIIAFCGTRLASATNICTAYPDGCTDASCQQTWPCSPGARCGEAVGECSCLPCYEGEGCTEMVNTNKPEFAQKKDKLHLQAYHSGFVRVLKATDEDAALTCGSTPETVDPTECHCGAVQYRLVQVQPREESPFVIKDAALNIADPDEIIEGKSFLLKIFPYNLYADGDDDLGEPLDLEIVIQPPAFRNATAAGRAKRDTSGTGLYDVEPLPADLADRAASTGLKPKSRKKRQPAGGSGGGTGDTTMTLAVVGTDPTILYPGQSVQFELTAHMPLLSANMDLTIEIFVMDPVTAITPFGLCNVTIDAIGSGIKGPDGTTPVTEPTPVPYANSFLPDITDRVVMDFGSIQNDDSSTDTAVHTESEIKISFVATMVYNTAYDNTSAVITAGAEYNDQNYVWVSQGSYNYDMEPGQTYPSEIDVTGPDDAEEYSGASFEITAKLTDPQGPFVFEVYTPMDMHNKFSVSHLTLSSIGPNYHCIGEPKPSTLMYRSVDRKTNHRGVMTFETYLSDLDYNSLLDEINDAGNHISVGFSIFLEDARENEIVSIGAGISVGTTTLWTALINITVLAQVAPTPSPATYVAEPLGGVTTVPENGIITYAIKATIPNAGSSAVDCTCPAAASQLVVGVTWGNSGVNIGGMPFLENIVEYDAGSATWALNVNSTGDSSAADANIAVFEVSVVYQTTSPVDMTCTCEGNSLTLTAPTNVAASNEDVSGTADGINSGDYSWYLGSQQGLVATLNFPAAGVPYTSMTVETAGDYDITAFGARVCRVEIMEAGRGVPSAAGPIKKINDGVVLSKATASSIYDDGTTMDVGPTVGVNRGTEQATSDNQLIIRMAYDIPKSQTITAESFNMSMGILFDTNLIWTGWASFTTDPGTPSATEEPIISIIPLTATDASVEIGAPTVIFYKLKTKPGSVGTYTVTADVTTTATIYLCRIVMYAVGRSYPCLDDDPYGKHLTDVDQPNTIIHNAEWGLSAVVDLGTLRNVGFQEFYADEIADQDSIVLGIVVRGVAVGVQTMNIITDYGGTTDTKTVDVTVSGPLTPSTTEQILSASWEDDGSNLAFHGIMKLVDLKIVAADSYKNTLTVTVSTTGTLDQMELCSVNIKKAGKNFPCIIPHLVTPVYSDDGTTQSVEIVIESCYYPFYPEVEEENTIVIQVGVALTKEGTGGDITATLADSGTASSVTIPTYTVGESTVDFDPSTVNITTEGFSAHMLDDSITEVSPGISMFYPIGIVVPPYSTGEVEIGVMAPTDGGRAYATLHSWRKGNHTGRNVGCILAEENYDVQLLQNSSLDTPMIHESQKDTFVVKLGYLTNTGLSYSQAYPIEPTDNTQEIEIEVMMADHLNATDQSVIPISIAIKFHDVIYVLTKELKIVRDAALDVMELNTTLNFTTEPANPIFDRVTNNQIPITIGMHHIMNISRREANDAMVRVLMPRPLRWVNLTDTFSANITGATLDEKHYLDINITNLFFTDYLQINLTLSVDPENDMIKGLGLIDAAILVRLVCSHFHDQTVIRYCGTSMVLPFQMMGTECYEDLGVPNFDNDQFSASTAIDAASGPHFSKVGSGAHWSPAVRGGPGWEHYITIDFIHKTRVTKIVFDSVAGLKGITKFKVAYSFNGITFTSPCDTELDVTGTDITLPSECRFEGRYGRLIIVDAAPDSTAFGVRLGWYGCVLVNSTDDLNKLPTVYTHEPGWRQVSFDAANNVFYFCDYNPIKKKNVCFSTADGATWNDMPAYIGSLVGPLNGKFYAKDVTGNAVVTSMNGVTWSVANAADIAGVSPTAKEVPGLPEAAFTSFTEGAYTVDFTGIQFGGSYVAKWESCCS